jgi:hypothetical protein
MLQAPIFHTKIPPILFSQRPIHRTKRIPKPRAAIRTANPQGQSPAMKLLVAPADLGEAVELAELVPTGLPAAVAVGDVDALLTEGVPVEVKFPFVVADPVEDAPVVFGVEDAADVVLGPAVLVLSARVLVEEPPGKVPII